MDYEKKYKEALEMAKVAVLNGHQNLMEGIFPELRESEDEKVRKALIDGFKRYDDGALFNGCLVREILPWLEKQGEQKPYGQREECKDCQMNYVGECKGYCEIKRNEQKPAWSEEDERNLQGVIDEIWANKNQAPDYDLATYDKYLSWLKSLKQRYNWKPSDEQMKALHDMNLTGNISYVGQGQTLIELYNDLKKLKGE